MPRRAAVAKAEVMFAGAGRPGKSRERRRTPTRRPGDRAKSRARPTNARGEYNHYRSTQSCTVYNSSYDSAVLEAYQEYSAAAGWPAHPYVAQ